jgi:hypothetical protein
MLQSGLIILSQFDTSVEGPSSLDLFLFSAPHFSETRHFTNLQRFQDRSVVHSHTASAATQQRKRRFQGH